MNTRPFPEPAETLNGVRIKVRGRKIDGVAEITRFQQVSAQPDHFVVRLPDVENVAAVRIPRATPSQTLRDALPAYLEAQ